MRMNTLIAIQVIFWTAQVALAEHQTKDALPPAPQGKTWKLVWHDEFEGMKLDETKWDIPPDAPRKGGWWVRKAVSLDGKGHLVISALKEGDRYIDGCVRTRGKFEHSFGYYVARIQLQKQPGHWSAFWMMCDGVGKVGDGGRDGTEIDIYEKPWLDDRVQQTLHWDGYGKAHKSEGKVVKVPGVMEGWHTFGLWWKPDEYVFFVDGKETWRTNAGGVSQVPEFMKLSDEIGTWGGDIKKAKLPDKFLVDYVRVYDLVEKNKAPQGNDMQAYLQETEQLVREGRHKEALERFKWFHDHALEHDPAMYGVRLSFALMYWKHLGDVYPPAKQALLEVRDQKTKELKEGRGNVELFHDVSAINRELGQDPTTLQLLRELDEKNAVLAAKCWIIAKNTVLAAKQYDLARKYFKAPLEEYERIKEEYDHNVELANDPKVGKRFKQWNENHFVEECVMVIEAARATGDATTAEEIRKRAVQVVDDPRLKGAESGGKK